MRGKFWLFFLRQNYVTYITKQILNMFECLHKNIVHFPKLRILPDREYDNEHDVSIFFARGNNELLLEIPITQRTGKEL